MRVLSDSGILPTWGTVAVALASLSCGEQEPFVGHVRRSKFFEYHERTEQPLCPTLLSLLDQHAEEIGGKLGLPLNESAPFRYYRFKDAADLSAHSTGCRTDPSGGGCALGGAVYSTRHFHTHELAHEYVYRAWGGWSNGLLNEGEAVALSCDPFYVAAGGQRPRDIPMLALDSVSWRDVLNLHGDSRGGYAAAGFFVSYLAKRFGWSSVAELHRRIPPAVSSSDFEREFARVYPMSMTQAWLEALDAPGARTCEIDWPCFGSQLRVGQTAVPDCDGELHRLLTVTDQASVAVSLTAATGAVGETQLAACQRPGASSLVFEVGPATKGTIHWVKLPEGSYAMIRGASALPSAFSFLTLLPSPLVGDACETSPTVPLDASLDTSIDLSSGTYTGWIRVAGGGRTYRIVVRDLTWNEPLSSGALALCDDCGPLSTCVGIAGTGTASVSIPDSAVVRLREVFALPPTERTWGRLVFGVVGVGDGR